MEILEVEFYELLKNFLEMHDTEKKTATYETVNYISSFEVECN